MRRSRVSSLTVGKIHERWLILWSENLLPPICSPESVEKMHATLLETADQLDSTMARFLRACAKRTRRKESKEKKVKTPMKPKRKEYVRAISDNQSIF